MKHPNSIQTLRAEDFLQNLMSYYDSSFFEKENFNDFFIHNLATPNYKLKLPLPPHRMTANSLLVISKGVSTGSSGLDNYTLSANCIAPAVAGQIISSNDFSKDIEGFWLHFSNDFLSYINIDISDWMNNPVIHFDKDEMDNMIILLKRMEALNTNPQNTELIKLYLATLLTEIKNSANLRPRTQFKGSERIVLEFKRLLNLNMPKQKSVSFYAQKLNISPNHLNKCVKQVLGKSASLLIDEMLLLEVKILIHQDKMTISEIAFHLGFEDRSYFGKFFKKHTGYTPTKFRKTIGLSE